MGHLLANGAWIPWEPGQEVVINGILFVPPLGTENRRVRGELGAFKLDMGDGYLLHGTPHKDSIGTAVTHGCIRVPDEALRTLCWSGSPSARACSSAEPQPPSASKSIRGP